MGDWITVPGDVNLGPVGGQNPFDQLDGEPFLGGTISSTETSSNDISNLDGIFGESDIADIGSLIKDLVDQGKSGDEILKLLSSRSNEWAEKYLDYLLEKESLDAQNRYVAERQDSSYQRLVEDLRKAGLNPAMMYGSSASISPGGSLGYLKQSEGANTRQVSNYSKLSNLMLQYMLYVLKKELGVANTVIDGIGTIGSLFRKK